MNRRNMLKVLPLAAMVGATVKLGEVEATAYEMKAGKKYLFVLPDFATPDHVKHCGERLRERGVDAVVCNISDLKIYELE